MNNIKKVKPKYNQQVIVFLKDNTSIRTKYDGFNSIFCSDKVIGWLPIRNKS